MASFSFHLFINSQSLHCKFMLWLGLVYIHFQSFCCKFMIWLELVYVHYQGLHCKFRIWLALVYVLSQNLCCTFRLGLGLVYVHSQSLRCKLTNYEVTCSGYKSIESQICFASQQAQLTLWTPEVGIPTLRKLPYAARMRYTVGTVCYRTRQKSIYLRHGV